MQISADPYVWPFDGRIDAAHTALLCIDWQTDFCGVGGYVDTMGYDLSLTRRGLEPTARVLDATRKAGWTIIHTREGHRTDLSDCPPNTDLDLLLRTGGITHLVFTGITTDVCVHTTMREANDRGYECLLLSDCTGATDEGNYRAALKMITMQGGVFGAVATSRDLLAALAASGRHD